MSDSLREQIVAEMRTWSESDDMDRTHSDRCWRWHSKCAIGRLLAAIQSLPSPAAPESGEEDYLIDLVARLNDELNKEKATIATLTAEVERLKSDYAELAGIAERMLTLVKVDPLKEHCECLACSVQREYATHQAKGKP